MRRMNRFRHTMAATGCSIRLGTSTMMVRDLLSRQHAMGLLGRPSITGGRLLRQGRALDLLL